MSKTGRYFICDLNGKVEKVVEPINEHPERNADWKVGVSNLLEGGSIKEKDSIITQENGFKNIQYISNKQK